MICTTCARLSKYLLFFIAVFVCFSVTVYAHTAAPTDSTQSETSVPAIPDHILLALRETFFQNVIPLALPLVNKFLENTVIPAQKMSMVEFEEIKFDSFAIGNASLTMKEPNEVFVSAYNISAAIPSTVFKATSGTKTCEGTFEAALSNTNSMLPLRIIRMSNGTVSVKTGELAIEWGSFTVHHTLSSAACRTMESTSSFFLGDVNKLIISLVEAEVPRRVRPVVDEKANEFLSALPFVLTHEPDITSQQMTLSLGVVPDPSTLNASSDYPLTEELPSRDAAASISERPINKVIEYLTTNGVLNRTEVLPANYNSSLIKPLLPDVYKLCPECFFALSFRTALPPVVELRTEQTVIVKLCNLRVALELVPAGGGDPVFLLEFSLNMTGGIKDIEFTSDNKVTFKLTNLYAFSLFILASNIGPETKDALSGDVLFLANSQLIPFFNAQFKGIQLPSFVNDPVINVTLNEVIAGVNVKYEQ